MKRSFLTLALLATIAAGGAYASKQQPVKQQPANSYTYYLEDACNQPVICSPEFEGPVCADEFSGIKVYDAPGCEAVHETINIIGKRPI